MNEIKYHQSTEVKASDWPRLIKSADLVNDQKYPHQMNSPNYRIFYTYLHFFAHKLYFLADIFNLKELILFPFL